MERINTWWKQKQKKSSSSDAESRMHWLADSSWEPYPLFNHPNHYTSPNTFSLLALSMSAMPALWECSSLVLISPVASWPAWQLCLQPSAPLHFSQGHWAWDQKRGQSPRSTSRSPGINERLPDTARKITLDVIGLVRSAWYIPTMTILQYFLEYEWMRWKSPKETKECIYQEKKIY